MNRRYFFRDLLIRRHNSSRGYPLAALLLVASSALNFNCRKGPPHAGEFFSDQNYYLAVKSPLDTLDPIESVDLSSGKILGVYYRRLYRSDLNGRLTADLVTGEAKDVNRLILTIKRGVTFSDGTPLKGADVVYCLNRLIESGRQSWLTESIQRVEAVEGDDYAVAIGLKSKEGGTLETQWRRQQTLLSLPQTAIYSAEAHRKRGQFLSASGLEVSEKSRNRTVLTSIEGPSRGREIHFLVVPEESARWFYFQKNLLDFYEAAGVFRYMRGNEEYQKSTRQELTVLYGAISAPSGEGPLGDVEFRRALNDIIDRESLTKKVLLGAYSPADFPVPPLLMAHLNGAQRLGSIYPREGGEGGRRWEGEITIFTPGDRERQLAARAIRAAVARLGVEAEIQVLDLPTLIRFNNSGRAGIYLLKWVADYPHAENFLIPLFHSSNAGSGGNRAWYENSRVDALLDLPTLDGEVLLEVQRIIRDDAPWVFIGFSQRISYSKKGKGIEPPMIYTGWSVHSFFP